MGTINLILDSFMQGRLMSRMRDRIASLLCAAFVLINMTNLNRFTHALKREVTKLSRIFVDQPLHLLMDYQICEQDCHYITSVMRLKVGSSFRVFNGRDGEFVCEIDSIAKNKKSATGTISQKIRDQLDDCQLPIVLYCAPLKKPRMKMLLEKVTSSKKYTTQEMHDSHSLSSSALYNSSSAIYHR